MDDKFVFEITRIYFFIARGYMRDKNSLNHKNILIMKTNVGLYDQTGRVLLGIAIAALYYFKGLKALQHRFS